VVTNHWARHWEHKHRIHAQSERKRHNSAVMPHWAIEEEEGNKTKPEDRLNIFDVISNIRLIDHYKDKFAVMRELGQRVPEAEAHLANIILDHVRDDFIGQWDDEVKKERDRLEASKKEQDDMNYD
jgi:hypothetical protein